MDTGIFAIIFAAAESAGSGMRATLLPEALPLLGAILALMLAWQFVKHLLGDGFIEVAVNCLQTLFMAGIIAVFLSAWTTPLPGTDFSVSGFFDTVRNDISKKISGNMSHSDVLTKLLRKTVGLASTAATCAESETYTPIIPGGTGTETEVSGATVCVIDNPGSGDGGFSFSSLLSIFDFLIAVVIRLISLLVVICAIIFYALVMLLSMVLMDIGFILGPMMLPFLIWPSMSWLFDGWLRAMITASLYKVVATIILVYVGAIFSGLNAADTSALTGTVASASVQTVKALSVLLIACAGLYLMIQIQSITGMFVGGGSLDMSPRLGRMASNVMRFSSRMSSRNTSSNPTTSSTPSAPSARLGTGGGRDMSRPALNQRADTGGWGRGGTPRPPRPPR